MRHTRILGIAILIAMLAAISAPSAAATENTALCKANEDPCSLGHVAAEIHMVATESPKLLATVFGVKVTILCLSSLVTGEVESPYKTKAPEPLGVKLTNVSSSSCGTNAAHNNCTVTTLENGLVDLLKTGLNKGSLTALGPNSILVFCDLGILGKIHCDYGVGSGKSASGFTIEGASPSAGHGVFNASGVAVPIREALSGACPTESILHALYETLKDTYIVSSAEIPSENAALCKIHESKCAEKNLVSSVHIVSVKPPLLLNSTANVECEVSLGQATVLGLGTGLKPQIIDITELTWQECHTQGAADNCTVTNEALPVLELTSTVLNLGVAVASGGKLRVKCTILGGLVKLDCTLGDEMTMEALGSGHTEGAGKGMLTASKAVVKRLETGESCPETAKWDLLYEPLEAVYIVS